MAQTDGYIQGVARKIDLEPGQYRDENFDPIVGRGAAALDLIDLDATNIKISSFDGVNVVEEVYGHRELNHDYKESEDLHFHVHWAPVDANAGNVKWFLEYEITSGDGASKSNGTLSVVSSADGTAWLTKVDSFAAITGTSFTIGDQVSLRFYRDPSGSEDTYGSDAVVKTFGYHYRANTIGSNNISSK